MQEQKTIATPLRHAGTGRFAAVVRAQRFWDCEPVSIPADRYLLFIASEHESQHSSIETARAWIDAGASYVCAWGPNSPEVEDAFDYATFLPELGEPLLFTLMTTSHADESLEEALWFAFYSGWMPGRDEDSAFPVVVVADSPELELRSVAWIEENAE